MTGSLGFVILARDAGAALTGLAQDIAALARPGDSVLLVDDGARDDTPAHIGRMATSAGWGPKVAVTRIICATRGQGDLGVAANLALQVADGDRLVLLPGSMRLKRAAFAAARARAEVEEADLVVCGRGLPAAHRLIVHRRLLTPALRWAEGQQAHGDLAFVMRAEQQAENLLRLPQGFAEVPPETAPDMGFSAAALLLLAAQPVARAWLLARAAEWDLPAGSDANAPWAIPPPRPVFAPARVGAARMRLACIGRHANRQPFAHEALRPLWQDFAELVAPAGRADLVIVAHPQDARQEAGLAELAARRPVALLSEEPFWDTLFSPDPLANSITLPAGEGAVNLHQRNHHNSAVFAHRAIPYYLLTHHRFAVRHAARFARNAALGAAEWQEALAKPPVRAVFMAARRVEGFHDISIPKGNIIGLCAWRTRLAQRCCNGVERSGEGWPGSPGRMAARDWHLEKLVRLDRRAQMISAVENTHQPNYLSEKLFDAFACGALPLFMASPLHRIHDLGLPEDAWINLWGLDEHRAAQHIDGRAAPGLSVCVAYAKAQARLAELFSDNRLWLRERHRLTQALRAEVTALADLGPAV